MDVVIGNRFLELMFVIEKEQQAGTAATNTLSTDGNSDQQNDDANAQGKKDNTFEKNLGGAADSSNNAAPGAKSNTHEMEEDDVQVTDFDMEEDDLLEEGPSQVQVPIKVL
jgi:hypothetical protein